MKPTSNITAKKTSRKTSKKTSMKIAVSAATLFASAFFVMTPPIAHADDYCIKNGAQAAHGCGYPTMEACQAAASGVGGMCGSSGPSSSNPSDALAYQPKQPQSRSGTRSNTTPKAPPPNDD